MIKLVNNGRCRHGLFFHLSDFLCKGSVLGEITLKYSYGKDVISY
ncbi:hypothetical protein BACOVA_04990 [Bacteroides ovatus ATCC 8483]|uniref:Uncharacterized protein n=1 Tax=Bacteroides ovatus (strain ATCC 8483 / DSM 1896 / JCM 5824 / BCRC 10623 / CCUG 4943 / NCTC 11153) TaxID=411476 RepID=A0AAN3A360_BACO1|nr:hypothetical protein BACOVA_04990 [Bacteroides ovatus ATCC 8483]